jgi:serine O-acetyltransferase
MNDHRMRTGIFPGDQPNQAHEQNFLQESDSSITRSSLLSTLIADVRVIYQSDPAARNWLEVLLCYPGLQALWGYRLTHYLYALGIPLIPRLLSQLIRWLTGIEIHPGAHIGKGVFIDHGMGVVIGETAIVGDYSLIYQGVTLGGTGKERGKRHPTLGSHVIVGAGAKVLGNIQIGDRVRIGAGSVVLRNVPSDCTVVGVPGRITRRNGLKNDALSHSELRDTEAEAIRALFDRIKLLEHQIAQVQIHLPQNSGQTNSSATDNDVSNDVLKSDLVIKEFLDGAGI